jgi:hypothetical protein
MNFITIILIAFAGAMLFYWKEIKEIIVDAINYYK